MMRTLERRTGTWRLSLEQIEATVADHLGNGRVTGNQAAACLSRQASMYLAKNVGDGVRLESDDSTTVATIPPFFMRLRRPNDFRQTDESLDALVEVITAELSLGTEGSFREGFQPWWTTALIDTGADRVLQEIRRRAEEGKVEARDQYQPESCA